MSRVERSVDETNVDLAADERAWLVERLANTASCSSTCTTIEAPFPSSFAVAFNRAVREHDEWFDEPDDLGRVSRALGAIEAVDDPIEAAAVGSTSHRIPAIYGFPTRQ